MSATLPPVLTVGDVMDRYSLRDRRAARRLMDEAGAFYIAGRLVVRLDDLDAHERALRDARRAPAAPREAAGTRPRARTTPAGRTATREPLTPGWWRDAGGPA